MSEHWVDDLEKAQGLADRVVSLLEKHQVPPAGSDAARIRGQLAQLTALVEQLERSLMSMSANPASYDITRYELTRRGEMLAALSQTRDDIDESLSSRVRTLVANGHRWTVPSRPDPAQDTPPEMMTDQMLHEQDQALDYLQGSVETLKHISHDVTGEVDLHSRLLEDVELKAEQNRSKFRRDMALMQKAFEANTSECCLWMIILSLILANFLALVAL